MEETLRGGRLNHEHHDMSETCETATADMDQAIPRLAGDIAPFDYAQGRLRQGGKRSITYHAAAGETDFHRVKRPVWILIA
jgi:hypothetical protein